MAVLVRLLPHPPNFTPITALALFGATTFRESTWRGVVHRAQTARRVGHGRGCAPRGHSFKPGVDRQSPRHAWRIQIGAGRNRRERTQALGARGGVHGARGRRGSTRASVAWDGG